MVDTVEKTTRNYGSWNSPITSDLIVSGSIALGSICVTEEKIFWLEGRPTEGGRYVLVQQDKSGQLRDLTPAPFNVRTRVHEYGGGSYLVDGDTIYFSNFADQQLYRFKHTDVACDIEIITDDKDCRFANMTMDGFRHRLIAIVEDHSNPHIEAINSIVTINPKDGKMTPLASGYDFYSSPVLSPDGNQLAWMCWNHPNMPWDESEIWLADLDAKGMIAESRRVSGGENESTGHPIWSPDGKLYFVSDKSGWWNICRLNNGKVETIFRADVEFGSPHWSFGLSNFLFRSASQLICTISDNGEDKLVSINLSEIVADRVMLAEDDDQQYRCLKGEVLGKDSIAFSVQSIDLDYSVISHLQLQKDKLVFLGASPINAKAIVALDLVRKTTAIVKVSADLKIDTGYLSIPETISYPSGENAQSHGFYYAPANKDFIADDNEKPPLLVFIHGGPTGATSNALTLSIQYWTSRGFAVLDVNYRGSTGFGRAYRNSLYANWGVVDTEDCIRGAQYLLERGDVDGDRLAIRGGSAGGYTTLAALTFFDVFKAGASYYGVSDLEALARDTHKFESRYLDRIIGPYPQQMQTYRDRSPINHTDKLACPVIFFQGLEDKVVPPNQTEMMVSALRDKGLPVAYVPFAEEQHGFRVAANIKRALDAEYYFYSRIFDFSSAEEIEPVTIDNLTS